MSRRNAPLLAILTQALNYVVIGVAAAVLVLAIGKIIGGHIILSLNLFWLLPLIATVVLTSLAIAFLVAGLTSSPQTASNVGATISFLLFALTGAMLPIEALPDALREIVPYVVPHTAIIQAIRGISLTGADISVYQRQVMIGIGWLAAALAAAALAYRFTDD